MPSDVEYPWHEASRRRARQRQLIKRQRQLHRRGWMNCICWLPRKIFRACTDLVYSCSSGDCCENSTTCCFDSLRSCGNFIYDLPINISSFLLNPENWKICGLITVSYAFSAVLFFFWFNVLTSFLRPREVHAFTSCASRVDASQVKLFDKVIYVDQNGFQGRLTNVTENATLCATGFQGNSDVYGLGIRTGIYLQWISSLIANHTMLDTRKDLAQAHLLFLLAIVVAVMVMTFRDPCDFAIEIVIMYYMFFGGYVCVFIWPNIYTKRDQVKWIGPTLMRTILMILYLLMLSHASWFWVKGYDVNFARSPCGTFHFFFGKLDDSYFIGIRALLAVMAICGAVELAIILPAFVTIFAEDFGRSIKRSELYQNIFPKSRYRPIPSSENAVAPRRNQLSMKISLWRIGIYRRYSDRVKRTLGLFREPVILPDAKRRIQQVIVGALGCVTFIWSVLAIELIIYWNKITGVYTVASTGQYIPLAMGIGGFMQLLWGYLKIISKSLSEDPESQNLDEEGIDAAVDDTHELEDLRQQEEGGDLESANASQLVDELDLADLHLREQQEER